MNFVKSNQQIMFAHNLELALKLPTMYHYIKLSKSVKNHI